jgi:hypothetical protein
MRRTRDPTTVPPRGGACGRRQRISPSATRSAFESFKHAFARLNTPRFFVRVRRRPEGFIVA